MTNNRSNQERHKYVFPIVDAMVDEALKEVKKKGEKISCRAGCSHCCYLLVEVAWEEAVDLATWILKQPSPKRQELKEKIAENAHQAKSIFKRYVRGKRFTKPARGDVEIPDAAFDRYFYRSEIPCPFLDNGSCSAYEVRPTPCRLHFVSSPVDLCRRDVVDDTDYHTPKRLEQLKKEAAPVIGALQQDPRWGHLGIMVEAALKSLEKTKKNLSQKRRPSIRKHRQKKQLNLPKRKAVGF